MKIANSALLYLLGILLLPIVPREVLAQVSAFPPERFSYQGYVTDGTGAALATNAPKNYDIVFRIWKDPSTTTVTNRLWTEQQTVTVDKGYFSVILGEGGQYASEPRANLSSLFSAADASDRYVELTVRGIGSGGSDVVILPRLRLLPSPYAFLARTAGKLVSSTGADLVAPSGSGIAVNGSIVASSLSGVISGTNLTAGSVGSAQLAANSVTSATIAPGAVGTSDLAAGAVGTAQLASNSVTSAQIAANAVGTAQIAAGAVTSAQIANNTIVGADIATAYALWDNSGGNISYSAGDVSVGVAATPKSLTVTSNLNVFGNLVIGTTNPITFHPPQVTDSITPSTSTIWDIKTVDVSAFATNSLGGFKLRIYEQFKASFDVRIWEATMVFEKPGFTTNADYPAKFIRGAVTFMSPSFALASFKLGNPASGGATSSTLVNFDNFVAMYDYNPASLNGGTNSKNILPLYQIYVAFHPSVNGRIVVSDN